MLTLYITGAKSKRFFFSSRFNIYIIQPTHIPTCVYLNNNRYSFFPFLFSCFFFLFLFEKRIAKSDREDEVEADGAGIAK